MTSVPPTAKWFQDGFHRFLSPFLKRHFHTIAVSRESLGPLEIIGDRGLIVYGNHPSWWDPLIAHLLCRRIFAPRQFYAPIDAAALQKYQVFRKLGFFGIDLSSNQGAAAFLRTSNAILQQPNGSLWLTPEGRFADVRDHSAALMPGLAHLCNRCQVECAVVGLALEYVFWDERLPECLIRFSEPLLVTPGDSRPKAAWSELLTERLRENQRRLADQVIARQTAPFESLVAGGKGAGTFYDSMRRLRSWLTGREFRAEHGRKFN